MSEQLKSLAGMYAFDCITLTQVKEDYGRFLPQVFWDYVNKLRKEYDEWCAAQAAIWTLQGGKHNY